MFGSELDLGPCHESDYIFDQHEKADEAVLEQADRAARVANAMAHQKDDLIDLIEAAADVNGLRRASDALILVTGLWDALGYGYKIKELQNRINLRVDNLIIESQASLVRLRRTPPSRATLLETIEKLKALIK